MASEFAELWQYGSSKKHQLEQVGQKPTRSICRFQLKPRTINLTHILPL
jgi:hypothetical protein